MANPQSSSNIGQGFSWKDPSAKNDRFETLPWTFNGEKIVVDWQENKAFTPTKAVTPTATKALTPSASPPFELEYIIANKECRHGVCMPPDKWKVLDEAEARKRELAKATKEIGDIFVDNNTGETYIWEGDIFRQIAPTDFDINDYELVEDTKDRLVSPPKTDKDLECRDGLCMPPREWKEIDDAISRTKLAEESLNTSTHPTVLTWLIRKVELWDILDIFYHLEKIGERNALLVRCDSFSAAFRALGNTRLYLVTGFDYNALRKKYFEDDGKGYYSGETVTPIIQ